MVIAAGAWVTNVGFLILSMALYPVPYRILRIAFKYSMVLGTVWVNNQST